MVAARKANAIAGAFFIATPLQGFRRREGGVRPCETCCSFAPEKDGARACKATPADDMRSARLPAGEFGISRQGGLRKLMRAFAVAKGRRIGSRIFSWP